MKGKPTIWKPFPRKEDTQQANGSGVKLTPNSNDKINDTLSDLKNLTEW